MRSSQGKKTSTSVSAYCIPVSDVGANALSVFSLLILPPVIWRADAYCAQKQAQERQITALDARSIIAVAPVDPRTRPIPTTVQVAKLGIPPAVPGVG